MAQANEKSNSVIKGLEKELENFNKMLERIENLDDWLYNSDLSKMHDNLIVTQQSITSAHENLVASQRSIKDAIKSIKES